MHTMVANTSTPAKPVATLDIGQGDDTLEQLSALFAAHGDAFRVHTPQMGRDLLVLSHPDHVRHVLLDHAANYVKGLGIERVAILLGKGLMTSEGALWRSQRKALQPAFHRTAVAAHMAAIVATNARWVTRWRTAAAQGRLIDVTHDVSALTLEIVLRVIFGIDHERITTDGNAFVLLTAESDRDLRFAYAFRQLGHQLLTEITRRRESTHAHVDILQTLVDARDRVTGVPMADRQVLDEVLTLIVAGHETTASALQWLWYLLSRNPACADALHDEACSGTDRWHAPDAYPLARAVLAETLRLYPPGWLLTRRAIAAARCGDVHVQAGDDVLVSPYLVHRHPRFWPRPGHFDPARFDVTTTASRPRCAYLPFGLGPRACIGEPLALAEMLVHVVMVTRELRLDSEDGAEMPAVAKVNLRPARPLLMRAVQRSLA